MVATHFSGNAIKIGVLEDFEKPVFWKKMVELLPARFQGPPFFGCYFFLGLFFLLFSVSSASSKRVCKKNYFYRVFLHTLLKHLVTSCSNKEVKPKLPQKKVHNFFSETPFLTNFFFKNTNFAPPPENCAQKISQNPYFYRLKKRWPSYWPKGGQVIDPTLAKKWPSYWPYRIYIYISLSLSLPSPLSLSLLSLYLSLSLFLCFLFSLSLSISISLSLSPHFL